MAARLTGGPVVKEKTSNAIIIEIVEITYYFIVIISAS